uniref:NOL1/NOP2/Sun domain family member 4 n=1 Tax=Ditylenchus dipsaci TaxID=166011 RepID=A0A915DMR5_9BILA
MFRYGLKCESEPLASTCNQIVHSVGSLLNVNRVKSVDFMPVRYGAPRFKPKMAKTKQMKTPSMLALDHFDFYYSPLFGKLWPSIRLGLLTPNKFIAVMNRFSESFEANHLMVKDLGTVNLIEALNTPRYLEVLEKHKSIAEAEAESIISSEAKKEAHSSSEEMDRSESEMDSELLRTQAGLTQFRESTADYTMFDSRKEMMKEREKESVIRDSEFQVTGLEALGSDALPVVDDVFNYPKGLCLEVFPRGCLDDFPAPIRDHTTGITSWWLLDGGSVVPVLALDLQPSDVVLDMCAAPGGKSLLIAQTQKFSKLVCNDEKLSRLGQLRRALGMYIPSGCEEANKILIKRKNASSVENWNELQVYDKVLLDAPCTTDRQSVNSDGDYNYFASAYTSQRLGLPQSQTRMLVNALRSLKIGGSVVYSTCSLSPTQNECVVENAAALAKTYYNIECVEKSLKFMEAWRDGLAECSQQFWTYEDNVTPISLFGVVGEDNNWSAESTPSTFENDIELETNPVPVITRKPYSDHTYPSIIKLSKPNQQHQEKINLEVNGWSGKNGANAVIPVAGVGLIPGKGNAFLIIRIAPVRGQLWRLKGVITTFASILETLAAMDYERNPKTENLPAYDGSLN